MTRVHRVGLLSTFVVVVYLLAYFQQIPVLFLEHEAAHQILPVIPWWFLIAFGSYSLFSIGLGLFTFRECPEAYNELLTEISQAKNELRVQGVSVD